MFDSARCLEGRDYYRRAIRFAAKRGINCVLWHFTDDQGCMMQFDSVPGIGSPNAYTKAETKELVAFARDLGVTLIPELAALGHSRYITRLPQYNHLDEIEHVFTGMTPVAPQTRAVLTGLLSEVAEVFDSPWIHVGLDEANIGHHPLTREALQSRTKAELVVEHIRFIHDQVRGLGRKMMMWGDGLLHDRAIVPLISREIIICDWQYAPEVDGETVQYFLDEGFPVVLCPALICYQQPAYPGDQYATANIRSLLSQRGRTGAGKIVGAIETIWQPERYMHDSLWIGLDLACGYLKHGPELSVPDRTRKFARRFYGFAAPETWVEACLEMYRIAPLREEWLAVAKMEAKHLPSPAVLRQRSEAWRGIAQRLSVARPIVTRNRRAYRTLLLFVRLMAHLYRKAVLLRTGKPSAAQLCAIAGREQRLIQRVDAVWDRERFANDPKKYEPAREVMRDNHLTIVLRAAADVTRVRLKDLPALPTASTIAAVLSDAAASAGEGRLAGRPGASK